MECLRNPIDNWAICFRSNKVVLVDFSWNKSNHSWGLATLKVKERSYFIWFSLAACLLEAVRSKFHMDQSFVYHLKLVISRLPSQIPWWVQPCVTFSCIVSCVSMAEDYSSFASLINLLILCLKSLKIKLWSSCHARTGKYLQFYGTKVVKILVLECLWMFKDGATGTVLDFSWKISSIIWIEIMISIWRVHKNH